MGCPDSGLCALHTKVGREVPCGPDGCTNYVAVAVPPLTVAFQARLVFLTRLENYKELGCRFALGDLDPETWDELIVLAQERQHLDRVFDTARRRKEHPEDPIPDDAQRQIDVARRQLGVPQPGQSLFS